MSKVFRTIDLFAGVGGIRYGFEDAGFSTVFANDFDASCEITYNHVHPEPNLTLGDIREISPESLPDFEVLLGGFPCQPFSVAGYRQGFNDEKGRGNLFFKIAEILEKRTPEAFLLENVKNLQTHDKGNTYKVIEDTLKGLGYHFDSVILNTMKHGGLPQNRERIFLAGFLDEEKHKRFKYPDEVPLEISINDILEKNVDSKYYYNDKPLFEKIKNQKLEKGKVYQWRRVYLRENKSGVCPTLTANMGGGGHNVPIIRDDKGTRKLTPIECARLQGFPQEFSFPEKLSDTQRYKQMGNSVSVPVIRRVAEEMYKALNS